MAFGIIITAYLIIYLRLYLSYFNTKIDYLYFAFFTIRLHLLHFNFIKTTFHFISF